MIAIYARQSIDKKDSISIESQIDFCKKEFTTEKYKVYSDRGFSGSNTNRPQFEQMLKDIKREDISKVIVYKLDRISRSILDFAKIIELFKKNHVEFTSATEKFDTSTPMGNAMLNITMVFAQLERETIQRRIKDNYYARGKKGFFMGGKTPYGCIKEKITIDGVKTSILKPNPDEHNVLIKMFDLYSTTDISLGKLATLLNQEGHKSPSGVNWEGQKIQRILRNPVYVMADADVYSYFQNRGCKISNDISEFIGTNGCYLYGKRDRSAAKYTDFKNHVLSIGLHKGFISSHTWLACQYRLDKNKQLKNTGKGKYSWLSGLVKCGYCNYAMTVSKYKDIRYLNCRGKTNYKVCTADHKTYYVDEIEKYVETEIIDRFSDMDPVTIKASDNVNNIEVNQFKLQVIDIDNQINQLIEKLALSNDVVMDYINKKISELDSMKTDLLKTIEENTINEHLSNSLFEISKKIAVWDTLDLEEKKVITKKIIDKVFITNDEIKISWKY
ncbi:recombinase family protein [Vallitalea guaymasensis]|uniref:Recombinase family protein n=1 Tax=Vallitalea guaymasensis TaxID=1185412 RepID=A0A8J8M8Z3_9FIRM|nr:recombinase family protein [Vallitalea guaymasensis]QUH28305.1 recombinase family protein [Vallitalea guaymasensis]